MDEDGFDGEANDSIVCPPSCFLPGDLAGDLGCVLALAGTFNGDFPALGAKSVNLTKETQK